MENKQQTKLTKADNTSKLMAMILVLVILVAIGFNIYKVKTHKVYNQVNYQQQLNLDDTHVICNKIYKQEGIIKANFNLKPDNTRNNSDDMYGRKEQTIDKPIYYQVGYADEETANSNGVPMGSQWKILNQQIVSDGYLKIGDNDLITNEMSPEMMEHTYIFIAFYNNFSQQKEINRNNIEPSDIPSTIIQVPMKDVLEYVDVSNFMNEKENLKNNNNEEYNKQVEWITKNEFSPKLVETYMLNGNNNENDLIAALKQYSSELKGDNSNFEELFNNVIIKNNQFLMECSQNFAQSKLSNFISIYNIYNMQENKDISFYNIFIENSIPILNSNQSTFKQGVAEEEVSKENYKQYQTYKSIKDTLTIQQKYFMLMSIYE